MMGWIAMAAVAQATAAEPAAGIVPATPAAIVSGHMVSHPLDKVVVHVPAAASYAGAERFNLYGVADAEIHVFVEADADRKVRRLYWIQFESYLPSRPDARYDYGESDRRAELGAITTWLRATPAPTSATPRAGGDTESVRRILDRAGISVPEEVMSVRMVQLIDDPKGTGYGRRELMIIYSEDLAPTGKTLADLAADGKLNQAAWMPLEQQLIERATQAVRIERQ